MIAELETGPASPRHRKRATLLVVLLASTVGCHAPQPAQHALRGLPKPPKLPAYKDAIAGERKVLLDQLHRMAQQDAGSYQR
jgi:hypothetical protein